MGYWLKLYTDILEDPKYYKLSDAAKLGFYEILLVAKRLDDGDLTGELPSTEDIAFYTRRDIAFWDEVLKELISIGIIESQGEQTIIKNYHKRQDAIPDAERVKQFRKRRNESVIQNVTVATRQCNEDVTFRNGETETEKESDTETDIDTETEYNFSEGVLDSMTVDDFRKPLPKLTKEKSKFFDKLQEIFGQRPGSKTQMHKYHKLYDVYGEKKLLAACKWAASENMTIVRALKPMDTALVNWQDRKPTSFKEALDLLEEEENG